MLESVKKEQKLLLFIRLYLLQKTESNFNWELFIILIKISNKFIFGHTKLNNFRPECFKIISLYLDT